MLRGRYFNADDNHDAPLAVIIDERLADRAWPGENPLGRRLNLDVGSSLEFHAGWKVVGVVRHLELLAGMSPPLPQAFVSLAFLHPIPPRRVAAVLQLLACGQFAISPKN